ncbi:aromatic hydrocarbon degradation protein [Marinomonas mediterranea]|uniref:OmpP1/FadL family transporter n=1 Tax=Marinomonas mediterranea TaxID=119864 RepID=UPI00234A5AEC|nr:outer membrane protein transport protein [Marinomonas mediterranea]WCN12920.1 aromatic hydrocarbon degradation protein [Marinomonas mediterranea]
MFNLKKSVIACLSATLFIGSQHAIAAGFALNDHSATASGNALAGAAASREDISFSFWNPALLTNAKETTLYLSSAAVLPDMNVTVNSASDAAGNNINGEAGDVISESYIPSFYLAVPVTNNIVTGVSLNVPFGLAGDYKNDWAGRYHSAETSVQDIALAFSIAANATRWLSVGASLQLHSASLKLDSALADFAGGNGDGDGYGSIEGDDIGAGYSVGFIVTPFDGTRFGVGYRSEVDVTIEGDVTYNDVGSTLTANGVDNAYIYSDNTLPDLLTISLEQDLTDKLTFGMSALKTGWSSMQELRIHFDVGNDGNKQEDSVLTFGFEDTWFYSAGLTYDVSDNFTMRFGYAQDESPSSDQYRSARTPDGDREWYSLGGTYDFSDTFGMSFAYTYIDIDKVSVVRDGSLAEDSARGKLDADYDTTAQVFSLAINKAF